jgi:hypothetical protein
MHRDLLEISGRLRGAECRVEVCVDLKTPLGKKHNMKAGVVQLATKPHPLVFLVGLPWRTAFCVLPYGFAL